MPDIIPLQAVPNQTLDTPVSGQNCTLNIIQRSTGLYMSVFLNGQIVVSNVICQNKNRIIRDRYFGFAGDFAFFDTATVDGVASDPDYTGLGGRFQLVYILPSELPAGVG